MKDLMSKLGASSAPKDDSYDAKMQVLEELRQMAMDMMGSKLKDKMPGDHQMEQVSIAAPDKSGLRKGLDLASGLMEKPEDEESPMHEASESPAEEADEDMGHDSDESDEEMSPDEIEAKIQELQAKKARLASKSSY